jgi:hypothetical protein
MGSHHEEPPVGVEDVPAEEGVDIADASDDLQQEPDEKPNYTDRHPEHFRNPPGHVREMREDEATQGRPPESDPS